MSAPVPAEARGTPPASLDIVVPVYNEGTNILAMLAHLKATVRTPFRVLICYDFDEDDTLPALLGRPADGLEIELVKNPGRGPHSAVRAGFKASRAPAVLVYMADDDYNGGIVDTMMARFRTGADVVAASRFVPGGAMERCAFHKWVITLAGTWAMRTLAQIPIHDASNAFRLFSRRLLERVEIESREGFTFSIELMVKAVRLGWRVEEVPARWFERHDKPSRFRVFRWLPHYVRWLAYALATTWLRRGPASVR